MDLELLGAIDSAYHRLEEKQAKLLRVLSSLTLPLDVGWYNGHYHRDENGTWCREAYPIPVIGVRGLCDIELQFRQISVSTKRGAGFGTVLFF